MIMALLVRSLLFVSLFVLGFPNASLVVVAQSSSDLVNAERERCGEIIDMHLHPSNYTTVDPILEQMDSAGVSRGVLYSVYASNNTFLPDANTQVDEWIQDSDGRLYGLASLDTSGDWEANKDAEIARLLEFLEKPEFVGAKLATAHTCLELNGTVLEDVVQAISTSSKPILALHTGTTPFCLEFGEEILGYRACCQEQYVDPAFLEPLIQQYPNVKFVLLHTGFDFLPPFDEFFYNGTLVQNAIMVAARNENVYLEISALFPEEPDGRPRNPTGGLVVRLIKQFNMAHRVFYGSDANFPGVMQVSLNWAVDAMVNANYTEEERCAALEGLSIEVLGIPPLNDEMPTSAGTLAKNQCTRFLLLIAVMGAMGLLLI